MSEIWGNTVTELLERPKPPKWKLEFAREWIGERLALRVINDEQTDSEMARDFQRIIRQCADENTQLVLTEKALLNQIVMVKAALREGGKELPEDRNWLVSAADFMQREIPQREVFLSDKETGAPILMAKSLNQIFAWRGLGKSVLGNILTRLLGKGGDWLRWHSDGGCNVLLIDAELPAVQLQERLREFGSDSRLDIISPELMPDPKKFPVLSRRADQDELLRQIEGRNIDVIIIDTLTRAFKHDTNDAESNLVMNDFLIELRSLGYCVVLIHHAGKTGQQRGRSDVEDNLDVSIQLDRRNGWVAGDGLEFKLVYDKVRHGGALPAFEANYDAKTRSWAIVEDERDAKAWEMHQAGKTQRQIASALGIDQSNVCRLIRKLEGRARLNAKADQSKA